jgi:UDP-2,3-diacylglucosamine pyrophosphatase LpxH
MTFQRAISIVLAVIVIIGIMSIAPLRADDPNTSPTVVRTPYRPPPASPRYQAFISDLHFGIGRDANGDWHPTEDFRWPKALEGFLNKISEEGQQRVDLVIVGDFLELWQPPEEIKCKGAGADLGCSIDEMSLLVQRIVKEHAADLKILRTFAERGENRLHIIIGNHDSTLRYELVWNSLGEALNASSGRINLVTDGLWVSGDGRIVAEHGHQIGQDVNKYASWPSVSRRVDGKDYIVRPWGELFVQRLFNGQESSYPIIDNLSPETAGARYRAADRGLWGSSVDIAKFLVFNLLETSLRQKSVSLGKPPPGKVDWDVPLGREMGALLFIYSLSPDDPFRRQLEADGAEAAAVKEQLAVLAKDQTLLPDEEVQQLCDMIAVYEKDHVCWDVKLGAAIEHFLVAKRKVMARHLDERQSKSKSMRVFIYGHTHQYETPWEVDLGSSVIVSVANTGAFQRLIEEEGFLKRLNGRTAQEALRTMSLDELPPCYSAIIVPVAETGQIPVAEARAWYMPENGGGFFTAVDDDRCH